MTYTIILETPIDKFIIKNILTESLNVLWKLHCFRFLNLGNVDLSDIIAANVMCEEISISYI